MTRPRLPIDTTLASHSRRGGARGTGAASGSPPELVEGPMLLDSRQVARLLGIGRTKAFQLMARSELPVVRIGRCVRVPRVGLENWIIDRANGQVEDATLRMRGHLR
jgi:excisionase family DNA binding protein